MNVFYEGQVIWAQIDANQHMRHSAYADVAAQSRLMMMEHVGVKPTEIFKYNIGPVIFREELFYLREIGLNDHVKVTAELSKTRSDGSRWTIRHEIFRGDGIKAAIIVVDGAWIDLQKRKLAVLPQEFIALFMNSPKSEDFIEEPAKVKQD